MFKIMDIQGLQFALDSKVPTASFGTGVAAALGVNVGTAGSFVVNGGALGTPSVGVLTNCTGLPTAGLLDDAVTYAKLQNISAQNKALARVSSGAGNAEEVDFQTAGWSTWTPTIGCSAGSFTTVSATGRYATFGKTVVYRVEIVITTAGTASGDITATLPSSSAASAVNIGLEIIATGNVVRGYVAPSDNRIFIAKYDNSSIIGSGRTIVISGAYESV